MVKDASPTDLARGTLNRAREHLLGLQHAEGWWQGELETNVTMDAEDLLLREFLGLHDDQTIAAAARWIRYQQRDDGTWANFYGGPADLVVAAGGKQWAEREADAELAAANASLADIDLPADVRAELTAIAEFITARQW